MTAPTTKHCPGYGAQAGHDLPATTEYFHKNAPAKDGLFYQCKSCANAYQADYMARNRALAKAKDMPEGKERDAALAAAQALPPAPRTTKPKATMAQAMADGVDQGKAAVAKATAEVRAMGAPDGITHQDGSPVFTGKPDQVAARERAAKPKAGWGIARIGGQEYPVPEATSAVETPAGQAALAAAHDAQKAVWRQQKRDQAAKRKADEAATATA